MILFVNFLRQHRQGVFAFALLILALVTMVVARSGTLQPLRNGLLDLMGGIQMVVTEPVQWVTGVQRRVEELYRLDADNQTLKAELGRLRPQVARLEELEQENRRLLALLGMWPLQERRSVAGRVVGDSSSAYAHSLVVGVGERQGVTADLPVLAPAGLVGRVVASGERAAQVLTLLDMNCRVPVLVQRNRQRAIVSGTNGRHLSLDFVPKGADLVAGDLLITSGTEGIYPKGIKVGRVQAVLPDGPDHFLEVVVVPEVAFDLLEEVRILLPPVEPAPSGTPSTSRS